MSLYSVICYLFFYSFFFILTKYICICEIIYIERVGCCLEEEYTKDACQSRGAGISGPCIERRHVH